MFDCAMAEFARRQVGRDEVRCEMARLMCFARRARKEEGWNIVPVAEGYELKVPTHEEIDRKTKERAQAKGI